MAGAIPQRLVRSDRVGPFIVESSGAAGGKRRFGVRRPRWFVGSGGMCLLILNIGKDPASAAQSFITPSIMPLPIAAIVAAHWSIISSAPGTSETSPVGCAVTDGAGQKASIPAKPTMVMSVPNASRLLRDIITSQLRYYARS